MIKLKLIKMLKKIKNCYIHHKDVSVKKLIGDMENCINVNNVNKDLNVLLWIKFLKSNEDEEDYYIFFVYNYVIIYYFDFWYCIFKNISLYLNNNFFIL